MMFSNVIKLAVSFFIIFVFLGCNGGQSTPVDLIFGLKSYDSVDKVRSRVVREGGEWGIVENSTLSALDIRSKYEYLRVEVDVFNDVSFHGKTLLSFYNDKLMSVWFYANDWESYKKYLEKNRDVVIHDNVWENESKNVRSWVATNHKGRYYIAWEDIILSNSMNKWIEKNS